MTNRKVRVVDWSVHSDFSVSLQLIASQLGGIIEWHVTPPKPAEAQSQEQYFRVRVGSSSAIIACTTQWQYQIERDVGMYYSVFVEPESGPDRESLADSICSQLHMCASGGGSDPVKVENPVASPDAAVKPPSGSDDEGH